MAFKRRERALEYLSLFNAGLLAIHYSFESSEDLTPEKKAEAKTLLNETSEKLLEQLKAADGSISKLKLLTDSITHFVLQNREHISKRVQIRIVRYLKDVIDGSVYVLSLTTHRTMLGLRILAITFINFFAVLHPPMLVYQLSDQMPVWVLYVVSALGPLLLITLYNFQAHIEYPFDQKGTDDVKLDEFKLKL